MRQPAGGFHQFFRSGAAGPFQQIEDLGGLAAIAGSLGLGKPGLGAAFGRLLGRRGLAGRLGLGRRNVGATWRSAGLFVSLWLLAACRGGGAVFFWYGGHFQFLLG